MQAPNDIIILATDISVPSIGATSLQSRQSGKKRAGVLTVVTKRTISRGSERVVFGDDCCVVYTKRACVRKSVFVQKGGRFASVLLICDMRRREKTGVLYEGMPEFGLFFASMDSICEYRAFLPLFHAPCPFENLYDIVAETAKFTGDTAVLRSGCGWHQFTFDDALDVLDGLLNFLAEMRRDRDEFSPFEWN